MTVPNLRSFLDTDILVYADDRCDLRKQSVAIDVIKSLFERGQGWVSTLVLEEYCSVATRNLNRPHDDIRSKLKFFSKMRMITADPVMIRDAVDLHQAHKFSFWDALIVQAALASECRILYSEDMGNGTSIGGLKIVNAFT